MEQTQLGSVIESVMNVAIGYFVALVSQLIVFPILGIDVSIKKNIAIGIIFTVISLIRSYTIRRWFNARLHRAAIRIAEEL